MCVLFTPPPLSNSFINLNVFQRLFFMQQKLYKQLWFLQNCYLFQINKIVLL
nr:MAG TPA: hypothetical protein [Caudoviricetes sp.]